MNEITWMLKHCALGAVWLISTVCICRFLGSISGTLTMHFGDASKTHRNGPRNDQNMEGATLTRGE